jgi:signal transduction histidine kinase
MKSRTSSLLAIALVALLVLIGVATFVVGYSARVAQTRLAILYEARTQSDDDLDNIRSNVYLLGLLTRDYLLDSDSGSAGPAQYLTQYNNIRASTETSFQHLGTLKDTQLPKNTLNDLLQEFSAYSDITGVILNWTPQQKSRLGPDMLKRRLRLRQELFALTEKVDQLVSANIEQQREQTTQSDQQLRASLGWTSVIALVLGFAISAVTLMYTTRLEQQSQFSELELRRLSAQLRTTQEHERKSLSRELHDEIGQLVTGLRLDLSAIQRTVTNVEALLRLANAKRTAERVLRAVRNIAMLLRPAMLDDLGLVPALGWLCQEMSRSTGIEMKIEADDAVNQLPDAHRTCLYRVIQEAITNASHHSGARRIGINLHISASEVSCTVTDNGCGFKMDSDLRRGLGLIGMQERVRDLGGALRIVSSLGRGTRIEIHLPRPILEVSDGTSLDRRRSRDRSDGFEASA